MESVNVVVDNSPEMKERVIEDDNDLINNSGEPPPVVDEVVDVSTPSPNKGPSTRIQKMHPQDNIIGSPSEGVQTRSRKLIANACFISKVEPKNVKEVLLDEYWINVTQEELTQFIRNEVWNLVPRQEGIKYGI